MFLVVSCTTRQVGPESAETSVKDTTADSRHTPVTTSQDTEIIETFVDSLNIGRKGQAKIELIKHRVLDDFYVILKFYIKGRSSWNRENTYVYECTPMSDLEPNISDFNNDQFNDVTFISATAARSANQVRRLFVYDDHEQKLISIENSQDYPNMLYNKELNCIDAFLVYGGSSTVFLRIEGNTLKEFAGVNSDNYRTVYELDRFGKERILSNDTILNYDGVYTRYVNYKPLKAYRE